MDEHLYTELPPDAIGLIVRRQTSTYHIIGPTFPANIYSRTPIHIFNVQFFVIWWDAEDLLVLEWRISHYNVHQRPSEQTNMYLNLRVCATQPPSSYAMGPHDPNALRAALNKDRGASFLEETGWRLGHASSSSSSSAAEGPWAPKRWLAVIVDFHSPT